MAGNKTLYIREQDQATWDRAEAAAHTARVSLSQFLTGLIERNVPAPPEPGEMETIKVTVGHVSASRTEAFTGRWLILRRGFETTEGIAQTARGQVAYYFGSPKSADIVGHLDVYPSLAALEEAAEGGSTVDGSSGDGSTGQGPGQLAQLVAAAAAELSGEQLSWRDI